MVAKPQHIATNVLHIMTKAQYHNYIINSTYNERSTTSNKKALHIMGTAQLKNHFNKAPLEQQTNKLGNLPVNVLYVNRL